MIVKSFKKSPSIFVKLKGKKDIVREYLALISTSLDYSIIPRVDAFQLGYAEALADVVGGVMGESPNVCTLANYESFVSAPLITLSEVTIGRYTINDVEFIAFDTLQETGYDVILGGNVLRRLKIRIDYAEGNIVIDDVYP